MSCTIDKGLREAEKSRLSWAEFFENVYNLSGDLFTVLPIDKVLSEAGKTHLSRVDFFLMSTIFPETSSLFTCVFYRLIKASEDKKSRLSYAEFLENVYNLSRPLCFLLFYSYFRGIFPVT